MTMTEHEAIIAKLISSYNDAINADVVDMRMLNSIETDLKNASAEAKKDKKSEVYGMLEMSDNPMLEACRVHHFDYPSYAFEKSDGEIVGVEASTKMATISPVEFANRLIKASESKNCRYERVGVVKDGHCWEYRAEKLAYMLTYRTIKRLGGTPTEIEAFKKSYAIRDLAAREKMGETPTSTNQIVKLLQSIIDALVFVPNDKGLNAVKATSKDAEYLLSMFEKAGRGTGVVEVLKGSRIKDYIFTVCHMIVTGKAYEVKYAKRKDNGDEKSALARKPVESEPKSKKAETVEVSRPEPKSAELAEVSDVESEPVETAEVLTSESVAEVAAD